MENWQIELLKKLREERQDYLSMVRYCTDGSYILNNDIMSELERKGFEFDIYCGVDHWYEDADGNVIEDEDKAIERMNDGEDVQEIYADIYQMYIIDPNDAERFADYTNELIMYNEELNLYVLCVTHWGTSWDYVPSNWKEVE